MSETIKVIIPETYKGRCQDHFKSSFLNPPKSLDNEEGRRYEIRMPIPRTTTECKELFNLTMQEMIQIAVGNLLTRVDDKAKDILFRLDKDTGEYRGQTSESHIKAQQYVDNYRFNQPGPTKAFRALVQKMRDLSLLKPEQEPETEQEMQEMIKGNLAK